jgi:hypothetical protein
MVYICMVLQQNLHSTLVSFKGGETQWCPLFRLAVDFGSSRKQQF